MFCNKKSNPDVADLQEEDSFFEEINQIPREITAVVTLDTFDNKKYGNYTLVVNVEDAHLTREKVNFYVKVNSNKPIVFE